MSFASTSTPPFALSKYMAWLANPKIALWHIVSERTGLDADRQNILPAHDETSAIAAPANPFDGLRLPRERDDAVADRQFLDRHLAPLGQDQRAAAVTWRLISAVGDFEHCPLVVVGSPFACRSVEISSRVGDQASGRIRSVGVVKRHEISRSVAVAALLY